MEDDRQRGLNAGRVAVGMIILATGVLLLLDRTDVLRVHAGRFVAPFVLIVIGSLRLASGRADGVGCRGRRWRDGDSTDSRGRRRHAHPFPGLWLIMVGCWMLLTELHVWGLEYGTSWPLLIVAVGIMMVAAELLRPPSGTDTQTTER